MNEYILIAACGGFAYNVVPLLELWKTPKESRPDFGELLYWLPYIAWPFLAGFLLYLYESPELKLSKLLAFHIGVSAPLVIRTMIQVLPVTPDKIKLEDLNQ
ncbi:MAG: hypothetical protein A2042_01965 [Candidatus Schekmanbacteria bacterium GWA2_38_11]|uniref:Uncharacterized protein n=1 Tax=Candidatus Schekmanbacteria bacterium GWA2_38_11 TaxID=1817876 RepID=A0A1F7RNI7_9BACT|nr:MAG: hypothetical protein A2042_01965 [Candidatus Schekmanbacteria bacterium GWA2_38_11]